MEFNVNDYKKAGIELLSELISYAMFLMMIIMLVILSLVVEKNY